MWELMAACRGDVKVGFRKLQEDVNYMSFNAEVGRTDKRVDLA